MQALKKRVDFFNSEEGKEVRKKLESMFADSAYNTRATYTPDETLYPDNLLPFVDKHMNYLNSHPKINTQVYLANIRLMTRIKG